MSDTTRAGADLNGSTRTRDNVSRTLLPLWISALSLVVIAVVAIVTSIELVHAVHATIVSVVALQQELSQLKAGLGALLGH